jgi:septal ring factor EnvC (AmiA/AmiB activator)
MTLVKKANTEYNIPDDKLKEYLEMGYSQVDPKTGKIIKEGKTTDKNELSAKYEALKAEAETLRAENAALKAEIASLKKEPDSFICEKCGKPYATQAALKAHNTKEHPDG